MLQLASGSLTLLLLLTAGTALRAQSEEAVEAPQPVVAPALDVLADVARRLHVHVGAERIEAAAVLEYRVLRGGLDEVRVGVPAGWELLDVTVAGDPSARWDTEPGDDGAVIVVRLGAPTSRGVSLSLLAERSSDDELPELSGADFRPLDVLRERGELVVTHDARLAIIAEPVQGLVRVPANQDRSDAVRFRFWHPDFQVRLCAGEAGRSAAAVPRASETPGSAPSIAAAAAESVVEVETQIEADVERIHLASTMTWSGDVPGPIRSVAVPEASLKTLRVVDGSGTPLAFRRAADAPVEAGWAAILIDTGEGRQCRLTWMQDLSAGAAATSGTEHLRAVVTPPRILDSPNGARCSGTIHVRACRGAWVLASAAGVDVVPFSSAPGLQSWRYDGEAPPVRMELPRRMTGPVEVVVERALVETVIGRDRWATCRCRYRIRRCGDVELPIDLPAEGELLDARLDGRSLELSAATDAPAGEWAPYQARLAQGPDAQMLTLLYRVPIGESAFQARRGVLLLPLPRLGGAFPERVFVRELRTVVWMPDGYLAASAPTGFSRARSGGFWEAVFVTDDRLAVRDVQIWIGDETEAAVALPTAGRPWVSGRLGDTEYLEVAYWDEAFAAWLLGGAAVVAALVLRPTSWGNRLTMLTAGVLGLSVLAMLGGDAVRTGLSAARWGLGAAAAIWILDALRGIWRRRASRPVTNASSSREALAVH